MSRSKYQEPDFIIYGGCFDPPHQGHIDCVHELKKNTATTQIIVLPSYSPVAAKGSSKNASASFSDRVNMSRLAFNQDVIISTIESELATPSYTVNTLEALRNCYPGKQLAIAIGQDQMLSFDRWREPQKILSHHDLYVIKRPQANTSKSFKKSVSSTVDKLNLDSLWVEKSQSFEFPEIGRSIFLLDVDISDAESTIIRKDLKSDPDKIPSQWLPLSVLNYINEHQLYSGKL